MNEIKLIHGDSLQALKGYADNHFDWAIVDPPYGIDIASSENYGLNGGTDGRWNNTNQKHYKKKEWDKSIPTKEYFEEIKRVSKNQIIWGWNYYVSYLDNCPSYIVWDKESSGNYSDCETAWCSKKGINRIVKWMWNGFRKKQPEDRIHPTQKPIGLYKWILENYTEENDLILDTHLGSGSIAIACHYMKRKLIGYEIDKEYYDAACKRFKEQTMQQALW